MVVISTLFWDAHLAIIMKLLIHAQVVINYALCQNYMLEVIKLPELWDGSTIIKIYGSELTLINYQKVIESNILTLMFTS